MAFPEFTKCILLLGQINSPDGGLFATSCSEMEIRMELDISHINRREIYRYLGYQGQIPDKVVCHMIEEALQELLRTVKPRNLYQSYECKVQMDEVRLWNEAQKGELVFKSRKLAENLFSCERVILFAATLGVEADKLLQRYEIMNMAKASAVQACGAACMEAYCNLIQEQIREQCLREGLYVRPRFSPGYGDLSLEAQKLIFDCLQCSKRLGLTLTDSLLMYPTKSVTAFIGITKNKQGCHIEKCRACENTGCEFRYED